MIILDNVANQIVWRVDFVRFSEAEKAANIRCHHVRPVSFPDSECGKLVLKTDHYNLRPAAKVEPSRRV
jgi:hypothetical protein